MRSIDLVSNNAVKRDHNKFTCFNNWRINMINALTHWCDLPTPMGMFRMYDSGDEIVRIISYGDIRAQGKKPLLRIHSSCIASEVFGATDCDCADQLRESMKLIAHDESGIIVHLHQEGRGQGLALKIKATRLMQNSKLDTFEAFEALELDQDIRLYSPVTKLLTHLGIKKVRLISNNPSKLNYLQNQGIEVELINTHPRLRPENKAYLVSKNLKLGHMLPLDSQSQGEIKFYHSDQPWGELSNFSRHSIYLKNKIWPTVEHYYQAQKFAETKHEESIRRSATPILAKQLARDFSKYLAIVDWPNVKQEVMLAGLRAKFSQHPDLVELLISSGDRKLTEHTAKDKYWGDTGDGSGKNILGKLLMQVRSEIFPKESNQKKAG